MSRLESKIDSAYGFLFRHRWLSLIIITLLSAVLMSGMMSTQFSMDYRVFFGGNDKHLAEYLKQQRTYSKSDNVLIAIEPAGGTVFDFEFLQVVRRYTYQSWTLPAVTRVDSLTNFQESFATANDVVIRNLVSDDMDFSEALLKYVEKVSLSEPALVNRLVSADGRYTGIALTVQLPDGPEKNQKIVEIVREVRKLAADLERDPAVKKVYLSGTVMINNAFFEVSKRDLITLTPVMFLVIIIFMTVMVRSTAATALVFLKVALGVGISFGVGSFFGIQLTPPSVAAAPIIMMLSIADSVHVLSLYYKYYQSGDTAGKKQESMIKSVKANFGAVTLTSVTSIIGFLTMNFAESPPFHDLGNLVAIGAIAAYVLTLVLLPITITPFAVPAPSRQSELLEKTLLRIANTVLQHRGRFVWATLAVSVGVTYFVSLNELNDEFIKYFSKRVEFRNDNDFITTHLTGVYQIEYSLDSGESGGINNPEYLQFSEKFADWFRGQEHVMHVQTIADLYKKANMNLNDGDITGYKIPESREQAAQALLAHELSLPVGLDLNDQINITKSAAKFVVSLQTISANELVALEAEADRWLRSNAPPSMVAAVGTGPAVLFSHIGIRSIESGVTGGIAALLLICALLSVVFRSWKIGVISLVPNLMPAAMAFGVWGIVNGQVNMALATVLGMTLGIIVDDTVHFISKYRQFRQEGCSPEDAVRSTFSTVGTAIVTTTVVLVAGFSVLTLSPFIMNWGMGLLSAITIVFALFTDLFMLPALLVHFERQNSDAILVADNTGA